MGSTPPVDLAPIVALVTVLLTRAYHADRCGALSAVEDDCGTAFPLWTIVIRFGLEADIDPASEVGVVDTAGHEWEKDSAHELCSHQSDNPA